MQVRCQNCGWSCTLEQNAIARAIAEAQARYTQFHTFDCPQCASPIRLEVVELQRRLPEDYPLPEVKLAPPPPPAALTARAAATPPAPLTTNVAVVPKWDPKQKREVTQFAFRLVLIVALAGWILALYWLIARPVTEVQAQPLPAGIDLALILAPVLAAAAGIERFLETIFDTIERNWLTLVAYLGRGLRWLHSAESELQQARKWLADISAEAQRLLAQVPTTPEQLQALIPDQLDQGKTIEELEKELMALAQQRLQMANDLMAMAEKRLADAERELAAGVLSPAYKNAKRAASIVLGLWFGLIVATAGQMQMFAMLGIDLVPARVDIFITGLVIGSGTYPVHSLVGLLQQAKDTLDSTQSYLKEKGVHLRQMTGG